MIWNDAILRPMPKRRSTAILPPRKFRSKSRSGRFSKPSLLLASRTPPPTPLFSILLLTRCLTTVRSRLPRRRPRDSTLRAARSAEEGFSAWFAERPQLKRSPQRALRRRKRERRQEKRPLLRKPRLRGRAPRRKRLLPLLSLHLRQARRRRKKASGRRVRRTLRPKRPGNARHPPRLFLEKQRKPQRGRGQRGVRRQRRTRKRAPHPEQRRRGRFPQPQSPPTGRS